IRRIRPVRHGIDHGDAMSQIASAVSLYRRFHAKDPDWVTGLPGVVLPLHLGEIGRMAFLAYRSAKWSEAGEEQNYIHEYRSDVRFFEPWRSGLRRVAAGPWPLELVQLGDCLAVVLEVSGEFFQPAIRRGTNLVATPDGKRLALYEPVRGIVAVIQGGKQQITERGIEG